MGLLKKVKKVASVVNPVTYFTTDAAIKGAQGKKPDFLTAKPGPENPFSAMPNGFLGDTGRLDFLKDSSKFAFDPSKMKTFAGTYSKPQGTADALFDSYLGNINAPSSVDAVRDDIDDETMARLLEGADIDTRNSIGSLKSDFADRGLAGPGQISDIEASGLAQAYGDADRTRGTIRSEFAGKKLDRLKAKEDAVREAYAARYGAGVASDASDKQIAASGAMSDTASFNEMMKYFTSLLSGKDDLFAQLLNSRDLGMAGINAGNFNSAEDRRLKYAEPSYFDKLLDKVNIGIGI